MFTTHAPRAAIIFAVSGAVCRFILRHIETRWQILAFWCAIFAYQLVARPALGHRVSPASTILDLAAATIAVVLMKVAIEGRIWP